MNISEEMISKAKTAASAAELQEMAKDYNIEISESDAAEYFDILNGNRLQELSAEELGIVAGGKGVAPRLPAKYRVGQRVSFRGRICLTIICVHYDENAHIWKYDIRDRAGKIIPNQPLEDPNCRFKVEIA